MLATSCSELEKLLPNREPEPDLPQIHVRLSQDNIIF